MVQTEHHSTWPTARQPRALSSANSQKAYMLNTTVDSSSQQKTQTPRTKAGWEKEEGNYFYLYFQGLFDFKFEHSMYPNNYAALMSQGNLSRT